MGTPARSVRLTPRLRLRLIPLSSTPDTTGIPMLADTVLADTMADTVDTPAVDTTVMVMDAGMEVMPTTVKQTNKQINKQRKHCHRQKINQKLPSDIVLKISSKESKKV